MATTLTDIFREEVLQLDGVGRFSPSRRFTSIYHRFDPADRIFFVSSGLVKLFNRGKDGKEVILRIVSAGDWFGEDTLTEDPRRGTAAEILQEAVIFSIPRSVLLSFAEGRPGFWHLLASSLSGRQRFAEMKNEMLCTEDVETRIVHFVRTLAQRLKQDGQSSDFMIPLSQSELASLIGATRETTSTTLNMMARKGMLKLGRRLLIVPSIEGLEPATVGDAELQTFSASAPGGARS